MFDLFMFLGWAATAALIILLWRRRSPDRSVVPGVVVGLLAGLLWPVTLWIAVGLWWYWQGDSTPGSPEDPEVQLAQAQAFAKQAQSEGMPTSAAYWQAEVQRLTASKKTNTPWRNGAPTGAIVAVCALGSIVTLVVVGSTADVEPAGETIASPVAPPAPATTTAAPPTSSVVPSPTSTEPPEPVGEQVSVARIVDGDTVELDDGRTVRLLGIDTPEVHGGTDCWGPEASEFARGTLDGQRVRLVRDPTQDPVDQYGRTLAYLVLSGGRNYSMMAATAGAAFSYTYDEPVQLADEIAAAEADARTAGKGVWGAPCFGTQGPAPAVRPQPAPKPEPEPVRAAEPENNCEPGYDPCVPPYPPDVDCGDLDDGPYEVTGDDPHGLDGNNDGEGCE